MKSFPRQPNEQGEWRLYYHELTEVEKRALPYVEDCGFEVSLEGIEATILALADMGYIDITNTD